MTTREGIKYLINSEEFVCGILIGSHVDFRAIIFFFLIVMIYFDVKYPSWLISHIDKFTSHKSPRETLIYIFKYLKTKFYRGA